VVIPWGCDDTVVAGPGFAMIISFID